MLQSGCPDIIAASRVNFPRALVCLLRQLAQLCCVDGHADDSPSYVAGLALQDQRNRPVLIGGEMAPAVWMLLPLSYHAVDEKTARQLLVCLSAW